MGALNFGKIGVQTHSTGQTVLVSNVGNDALNFTHEGFSSGNTGDFAIDANTTNCNFAVPLPSGSSCNVGFIFTPTASGTRTAVLTLLDDTVNGSNTIQVTGAGATTATASPASFGFASEPVGTASSATAVTLKNTGTGTLTISSIAITGTGAASFSQTTTCGATLAAAGSCTISVTFKPTTTGSLAATLTITDDALAGPQTVALTGTATAAKAAIAPGAVMFSAQTVGTASAPKVVTITNAGTTVMALNAYAISGPNAPAFTQTHGCGTTLKPGASCTISVVFGPKAVGARTATLTVSTSAGPVTAGLSGTSLAAAAKVSLQPAVTPAVTGGVVELTSLVDGFSVGASGVVQLQERGRVLQEATLEQGVARFKITGLTAGVHLLDAVYRGDARHTGAVSDVIQQTVASMPIGHHPMPVGEAPNR